LTYPPCPELVGYRDSSADIAYCLQQAGENVITPSSSPDPKVDTDWCFPDTEQGVLSAIKAGANVLWANTTLHSKHSLVTLRDKVPEGIRFVGQNPIDTEKYEDKAYTNKWLERGELAGKFPKSWLIAKHEAGRLDEIQVPAVLKPIRGRGSHGVVMVGDKSELIKRAEILWAESDAILAEVRLVVDSLSSSERADHPSSMSQSYLAAEEITITVMPPGEYEVGPHPVIPLASC
jgi:D-alanine-D-alanine ligase